MICKPNEINMVELREHYYKKYGEKVGLKRKETLMEWFPEYTMEVRTLNSSGRTSLFILTEDKEKTLDIMVDKIHLFYQAKNCQIPAEKVKLMLKRDAMDFENYPKSAAIIEKYLLKIAEKDYSRLLEQLTSRYSICKLILETIQKELTEIDDKDIQKIATAISNRDKCLVRFLDELIPFMNRYYAKEMKHEISVVWKTSSLKTEIKKDFYSEEQWMKYTEFLVQIQQHIEKAFANANYAEHWLYGLLHLSLAWRKSDMLAIPALSMLTDLDTYTLDWFETHAFTLDIATSILHRVEPAITSELVQKTGEKKVFAIIPNLAVPTAIALLICEKWRRDRKNPELFSSKQICAYTFERKMGKEMEGFDNKKANRTLLSLLYQKALYVNQACTSYQFLPSVARSHKRNTMGVSQTTSIYLEQTYDISKLEHVPKQLMENGAFGYLYKTILKLCDDIHYDTDSDLESGISFLKQELSPMELETYSGILEKESRNRHNIINSLISCDENSLKDKLIHICEGKAVSKTETMYCASYEKCKNPLLSSCINCPYSIPTIHTLTLLNTTIFKYIHQLEEIEEQYTMDRIRITYFIQKLLLTIQEAIAAFGKPVVAAYVQFDDIKEALVSVKTKFLELG